jgi:deoxyribodipyrimidine photolyase
MSNQILINKLTKENGKRWFAQLNNILRSNCLKDLVSKVYDKKYKLTEDEDKKQELGLYLINIGLNDADQEYISDCETIKEAIDKLQVVYKKSESTYNLNIKFNKLDWTSDLSAELFIGKLGNLKLRMKNTESNNDNERFILKLLDNLPHFLNQLKIDLPF